MTKLVSALLSLYISSFLYETMFFVERLVHVPSESKLFFWNHLGIFLLFFVPIYFILNRVVDAEQHGGFGRFLRMCITTVALVGVFVSVLYHVLPLESVYNPPVFVDQFFAPDLSFALWLLVPLLILFF
ncbi:MAG: hypothetical protein AB200_00900 [Parcubacteria bacterium C7867-005]|nr:MAG: hypothetical protein AB200_00900 [Parcubacteria bacterium C7867-005]